MPMSTLWIFGAGLVVVGIVWLAVRAVRWAKKGSRGASMLAAAAFPFPEQPPPHELVDRANRVNKDNDSGDPKE
jgi:hypothetical protein